METPAPTLTFFQRLEFGFNLINHILISFVSIYMSYVCLRLNLKGTALHAWLCTLGYNLLMAEAVMTFFSGNFATYATSRKTKTTIHWMLQALGGTLALVGGVVKILGKSTDHFATSHGIAGLVALILTGISTLTGVSALFSLRIKRVLAPIYSKSLHNLIGLAAFVAGMVAVYYGYETGFFRRKVEPDFADMMRAFTIITLILSSWGGVKSLWGKLTTLYQ